MKGRSIIVLYLLMFSFFSCKNQKNEDIQFSLIETQEVGLITYNSATINGELKNTNTKYSSKGFFYNTIPNSKIGAKQIYNSQADSSGWFSNTLVDLEPGKTYYYKAFIWINNEYQYGEEFSFKTSGTYVKKITPEVAGQGMEVTISGVNFKIDYDSTEILFQDVKVKPLLITDSTISVAVPNGLPFGDITLTVRNNRQLFQSSFMVSRWTTKAPFPSLHRAFAISFAINNKGYYGLGYTYNRVTNTVTDHADLWEYDPDANKWSKKSTFPGSLKRSPKSFVIGEKAYVGGGESDDKNSGEFWEYDPTLDEWSRKADVPYSYDVQGAVAFSINDKGFLATGEDFIQNSQSGSKVFEYDPVTNQWQRKNDFPVEIKDATSFIINGKAYIGNGNIYGSSLETYSWFWEYSGENDTWTRISNSPAKVRFATGFSYLSRGFVFGGVIDGKDLRYQDMTVFQPSSNTWEIEQFYGTATSAAGSFVIGKKAFIVSGLSVHDTYPLELWEYSLE